jgi:hypothetical protein
MTFKYPPPPQGAPLSEAEQQVLCQEILAEIKQEKFKPAGEPSRAHWELVWSTWHSDVPPYIDRPAEVLRVNQQFVQAKNPWLEMSWYQQFRTNVLMAYFHDVRNIYEFGCGSGWNLAAAHELYPEKRLMGLDWAKAAVQRLPPDRRGQVFDFFRPDYDLKLAPDSGVWTVGALEQTGNAWGAFLEYLLANKPAICVHVEPIVEWYDPKNPVDQTAIAYHRARKYWEGFPAMMAHLQALGDVEIIEQQRSYFGSKYIEGYSLSVWRPL